METTAQRRALLWCNVSQRVAAERRQSLAGKRRKANLIPAVHTVSQRSGRCNNSNLRRTSQLRRPLKSRKVNCGSEHAIVSTALSSSHTTVWTYV